MLISSRQNTKPSESDLQKNDNQHQDRFKHKQSRQAVNRMCSWSGDRTHVSGNQTPQLDPWRCPRPSSRWQDDHCVNSSTTKVQALRTMTAAHDELRHIVYSLLSSVVMGSGSIHGFHCVGEFHVFFWYLSACRKCKRKHWRVWHTEEYGTSTALQPKQRLKDFRGTCARSAKYYGSLR